MVCKKCGAEIEGNFCSVCGERKYDEQPFEKFKSFLYDESEQVLAVLGNNFAQTFISTGTLGNGFAVLSDKRIYFKGKCLIRKGKGFYSKSAEKSVDVADVTGTGFVHNNAVWFKILKIISIVYAAFGLFGLSIELISGMFDPSGIIAGVSLGVFGVGLFFLFDFLYKKYNYSAFEISYAGGGIAFDMHWITKDESQEFQRNLNLLKDKIKYDSSASNTRTNMVESKVDVADELMKYKKLLDQGVITQEEFETKKKQLLEL